MLRGYQSSAFRLFPLVIVLALLRCVPPAFSQEANQAALVPPSSQTALQEIATKVAHKAEKAGCGSAKCVLLVTDFYTSQEATSRLGLKLSNEFALLLSKALPAGTVVDRSTYRQFMDRNRIPLAYLRTDDAQRWLGKELKATTVVWAEITSVDGRDATTFNVVNADVLRAGDRLKRPFHLWFTGLKIAPGRTVFAAWQNRKSKRRPDSFSGGWYRD